MARGDSYQLQGLDGGVAVGPGATFTGKARWIQFEQPTVLASYAGQIVNGDTEYITITHGEGKGIGGVTTSFQVTSGLVTAYILDEDYTVA